VAGACNAPNENVVVARASGTVVTNASGPITLGGQVSDTATLSGASSPTGTVTFALYGPDNDTCTGVPIFTSTKPVSGNGNYTSDAFTPTAPGTYRWRATYSGDANNLAAGPTACLDPLESVVVSKISPTLVTNASGPVAVGGSVSDTATLSGGSTPGGTITFALYGPADATCTAPAVFTSTVPVTGNGSYSSGSFTPTAPGTYRWVASYSGDGTNNTATSPCNAPGETVQVSQAATNLTTNASPGVPLGGNVSDTATVVGANPTGTVTFTLYGPGDATCSGTPVFTSTNVVIGGVATSGAFTPTTAGTYRWRAGYSGDANNSGASAPCNAPNESVVVGRLSPTLSTTASGPVTLGGQVSDTATLSGGSSPGGTITFTLYGPDDSNCSGTPAFTSTPKAVSGNGNYTSGPHTPTAAGTYRWIASYSGDANNNATAGVCNTPSENVAVAKVSPSLSTNASGPITLGGSLSDTATLSGGTSPGGTITFTLYGPGDAGCTGQPVFTDTEAVSGNGSYTSDSFTPTAAGTYRWRAAYSGDANNEGRSGACNDPGENATVAAPPRQPPPAARPEGGRVVTGTPGADRLVGTPGNDTINCGDGDDTVIAGAGDDVINCGAGNDSVDAGPGRDRVGGDSGNDRLAGGPDTDLLLGGSGNDRIAGGGSKDSMDGGDGDDTLSGNEGDDFISGGDGVDRIFGNEGKDTIKGRGDSDRIFGNEADDQINGGAGQDRVSGGAGNDRLSGATGRDRVAGGTGNDRINGNGSNDRLFGGSGADRLNGGSGNDVLFGGPGFDRLIGGPGVDRTRQ
jgi:Ca2+-binding RTX toxin-like protein